MPDNENRRNIEQQIAELDAALEESGLIAASDTIRNEIDTNILGLQRALEAGNCHIAPAGQALNVRELEMSMLSFDINSLPRVNNTIVQTPDGRLARHVAFSLIASASNIERAAYQIAEVLNEIYAEGAIYGFLSPLSQIELAVQFGMQQEFAICCMPLIYEDRIDDINRRFNTLSVPEGGVGERIGDSRTQLLDGEFLAHIKIYTPLTLVSSTEEVLEREIENYLRVLPIGTSIISKTRLPVFDLSIHYEVRFFNPILEGIREVEIQSIRHAARVNDHLRQCNLISGVRYTTNNGTVIGG
jgi:hypothetical protein